jgi:hypothetical protein
MELLNKGILVSMQSAPAMNHPHVRLLSSSPLYASAFIFTNLHAVLHTTQQVLTLLFLSLYPPNLTLTLRMSTPYEVALQYANSQGSSPARALAKFPPRQGVVLRKNGPISHPGM